MRKHMTRQEKESIDREVETKAFNEFEGQVFDMMSFLITKAFIRHEIVEERGFTYEQYEKA